MLFVLIVWLISPARANVSEALSRAKVLMEMSHVLGPKEASDWLAGKVRLLANSQPVPYITGLVSLLHSRLCLAMCAVHPKNK